MTVEPAKVAPMDVARAREINGLLVDAWMVQNGVKHAMSPSLRGVSLAEALEATRIVAADPGTLNADGSRTLSCFVEPTRVPRLYAWTVLQAEDTNA